MKRALLLPLIAIALVGCAVIGEGSDVSNAVKDEFDRVEPGLVVSVECTGGAAEGTYNCYVKSTSQGFFWVCAEKDGDRVSYREGQC